MRKIIVIGCLFLLFLGIVALFWRNEWVYGLPTKVPENYKPVDLGSTIDLGSTFDLGSTICLAGKAGSGHRPLFLHFFNPDCPCSRFNIAHFKSLVSQYGKDVDFRMVVLTNKNYTAREIQDRFDVRIPVVFDSSIAVACGVYSTPQAVIINTDGRLYYRGNYNRSRYCTDKNSNYAQLALLGILHKDLNMVFDGHALTPYGCNLPECKK
jgi:hypothetical protein